MERKNIKLSDKIRFFIFFLVFRSVSGTLWKAIAWINIILKGARCHSIRRMSGWLVISRFPSSEIKIGRNFSSQSGFGLSTFCFKNNSSIKTFKPGSLVKIGDDVELNGTSILCRSTSVTLGSRVMVAPNCIITDSDFHLVDPIERRNNKKLLDGSVVIEDDVWIGMNCTILKGSRLGKNSVISAGSVVSGVVPNNCVWKDGRSNPFRNKSA